MENLENEAAELLNRIGAIHNPPPYKHFSNNNEALSDNENFFMKFNTNPRGLQIELETLSNLSYAPKPLHPSLLTLGEEYVLVTKYVKSEPLTEKNIVDKDVAEIIEQIVEINNLKQNIYSQPRKLSETLNLTGSRLLNPNLTPVQKDKLNLLIDVFIKPYILKYENSPTLAHTDLHLKNILKKDNGNIVIIDYEGIKPSPVEADLAGLYQVLKQYLNSNLYEKFYKEFLKAYPDLDGEILKESILFKNTLTTTAAIRISPKILDERINIMMEALGTGRIPERLPPVSFS